MVPLRREDQAVRGDGRRLRGSPRDEARGRGGAGALGRRRAEGGLRALVRRGSSTTASCARTRTCSNVAGDAAASSSALTTPGCGSSTWAGSGFTRSTAIHAAGSVACALGQPPRAHLACRLRVKGAEACIYDLSWNDTSRAPYAAGRGRRERGWRSAHRRCSRRALRARARPDGRRRRRLRPGASAAAASAAGAARAGAARAVGARATGSRSRCRTSRASCASTSCSRRSPATRSWPWAARSTRCSSARTTASAACASSGLPKQTVAALENGLRSPRNVLAEPVLIDDVGVVPELARDRLRRDDAARLALRRAALLPGPYARRAGGAREPSPHLPAARRSTCCGSYAVQAAIAL